MGKENGVGRVRLQVTVDRTTAERVTELADRMGRTQSWLAAELLAEALSNQERLEQWFVYRVSAALVNSARERRQPSGETITLQTFVTPNTAAQVEAIAVEMKQSISKAAACLLESAVNDHGWIIEFVTSSAGRKVMKPLVSLIDSWSTTKVENRTIPEP